MNHNRTSLTNLLAPNAESIEEASASFKEQTASMADIANASESLSKWAVEMPVNINK